MQTCTLVVPKQLELCVLVCVRMRVCTRARTLNIMFSHVCTSILTSIVQRDVAHAPPTQQMMSRPRIGVCVCAFFENPQIPRLCRFHQNSTNIAKKKVTCFHETFNAYLWQHLCFFAFRRRETHGFNGTRWVGMKSIK